MRKIASSCLLLGLTVVAPVGGGAQQRTEVPSLAQGLAREVNAAMSLPAFGRELAAAGERFPALTITTKLLIAYLDNLPGSPAGGRPGFTPVDPPRPSPFPPELCRMMPQTCACRNGDRDACVAMVDQVGDIGGPGIILGGFVRPVPTCATLRTQYQQTLQAILTLLGQIPLTSAQAAELAALQAKADDLYAQLDARGCLVG